MTRKKRSEWGGPGQARTKGRERAGVVGDRGQAWSQFKSFCANTHVCREPRLFTQAAPTACSAPGSHPGLCPHPTPWAPLSTWEPLLPPSLCHHFPPPHPSCLLPQPHPQEPLAATLGQFLPIPWASGQGDRSHSKKQNWIPLWCSCLLRQPQVEWAAATALEGVVMRGSA